MTRIHLPADPLKNWIQFEILYFDLCAIYSVQVIVFSNLSFWLLLVNGRHQKRFFYGQIDCRGSTSCWKRRWNRRIACKVINMLAHQHNMCERESHVTDVRIVVIVSLSGHSVPLAFIPPITNGCLILLIPIPQFGQYWGSLCLHWETTFWNGLTRYFHSFPPQCLCLHWWMKSMLGLIGCGCENFTCVRSTLVTF